MVLMDQFQQPSQKACLACHLTLHCFPGQGVIAVAFSGTMCAHRVAADLGDPLFLMTLNV
jgi:hypothetical protein